jgi:hypothetical protein
MYIKVENLSNWRLANYLTRFGFQAAKIEIQIETNFRSFNTSTNMSLETALHGHGVRDDRLGGHWQLLPGPASIL